jgi:putative addiction module CopG family antidote
MTLTLHLPAKLGEYVVSQVASGCYADAEEVVRDAVRHHARWENGLEMDDDPDLAAALLAGVRSPKQELTEQVWASIRERAAKMAVAP